ncbi:MAG: death on curing protein [Phycisphaerales bacterium]|nr:death on curing protein [Phycisphaerales bacterium]
MAIIFLAFDDVLVVHRDQIARYGGSAGVRDEGLLKSAIGTVEATFAGEWLHEFPHGMAAAYLFHIAANHPFIDGNKRAGFACALAFLDQNGSRFDAGHARALEMVLSVARGEMEKEAVIDFFRQHVKPATPPGDT